jgi:transcriptional regulator with GAF, ATPase, and Fis domain
MIALPPTVKSETMIRSLPAEPSTSAAESKSESAEHVMRHHVLSVLQECHWRIKGPGAAADRLGVNPSTLRYRMKKLGIERPD